MIRIEALNKAALSEYIRSDQFKRSHFVPISTHRAISHLNNPRADEDDILLLLAYSGQILVGYLGILADWIFEPHGIKHKCGWLSCMWIDLSYRGQGISKRLVRDALDHWEQRILVTEFTVAAKGLYDKTGAFKDLQIRPGLRIYRRLDLQKFLPPKRSIFQRNIAILKTLDAMGNALLDVRFLWQSTKPLNGVSYFTKLGPEETTYLNTKIGESRFKKNSEDLNWIMQYPWILSSEPTTESQRYHFSSVATIFEFKGIRILDKENQIIGLLMLARRGQNLKLPFCYFEDGQEDRIAEILKYYFRIWQINTFTTYHPTLVKELKTTSTGALFKKEVKRHFIISKALTAFNTDQEHIIQDGDADCAFT